MPRLPRPCRSVHRLARTAFAQADVIALIVLVLVFAVVAISLYPSRRGHGPSQRVLCATNLRTCQQALMFYAQANRDYFPWTSDNGIEQGRTWEVLHRYVYRGRPDVFQEYKRVFNGPADAADGTTFLTIDWYVCPSDQFFHTSGLIDRTQENGGTEGKHAFVLSYASMKYVMGMIDPNHTMQPTITASRRFGLIRHPDQMVAFGEAGGAAIGGGRMWDLTDRNNSDNQTGWEVRHTGGCNLAFLDGRVEFAQLVTQEPSYGLPPFPQAFDPEWEQNLDWHRTTGMMTGYPGARWENLPGYTGYNQPAQMVRQAPRP